MYGMGGYLDSEELERGKGFFDPCAAMMGKSPDQDRASLFV